MKYKLSVCVVTYNQEKYIAEALKSIVKQKTNFKFKVFVGDDASTDNTPKIIKEYALKYPEIIIPILRDKNIGAINNSIDIYSKIDTEYAAICDGDDYFLDENKLQSQVDFLDKNKEYSLCFHFTKVIYEEGKNSYIFPSKEIIDKCSPYSLKSLLKQNFIQTNSVVYRWNFNNKNIKDYFPNNIAPGDYYLHLLHAKCGEIGFINKVMSVYRRHKGGIWSKKEESEIHLKYGIEELNFHLTVNKNIALGEHNYKNTIFDFVKDLILIFIKNDEYEKIKTIFKIYPEAVDYYLKMTSPFLKKQLKTREYPKWLIKIISCFISNKDKRHNFRKKYIKIK